MTPGQLIDTVSRYQVFLEGLKTQKVGEFSRVFDDVNKRLQELLGRLSLSDLPRGKVDQIIRQLTATQVTVFNAHIDRLFIEMPALATQVANFEAKAVKSVLTPEGRDKVNVPLSDKIYAEVLKRPVQATGELLQPLVKNWSTKAIALVSNTVRIGYEQGKTTQQIIQSIMGTKAMRFMDGVTAVNRRNASSVVRTSIQHVAATAREVTYEQNSDLIQGIEWVSTLDSKTTLICQSLDGKKFKINEGPRPPIHINCRSTTAPDLGDDLKFLDKGATRSSSSGPVSANETYYTWLKKQSPEFQDQVLGRERARLFRDGGLTPQRFAALQLDKNFQPLTLAQLRAVEPLAFQRAGLLEKFDSSADASISTGLPGRPKEGTATGNVWKIGDDLYDKLGRFPTRPEMLAEAQKLGINDSTTSVQFGKWKKAVGEVKLGPAPMTTPTQEVATAVQALTEKVVAIQPLPAGGEAVWNQIKQNLDAMPGLSAEQFKDAQLAADQLKRYYERFPDGKGGIDLEKMPVDFKTFYLKQMQFFKELVGREYIVGEQVVGRSAIHDLLAKLNDSKISQKLIVGDTISAKVSTKAIEARDFLDRVVADKFKDRSSISLLSFDEAADRNASAYYSRASRSIHMREINDLQTFVHEITHHFEYEARDLTPRTLKRIVNFLEARRGEEKYKAMSASMKGIQIFDDEWVKRGGTKYTSRVYRASSLSGKGPVRSTEVLTTGAERLFANPLEFYRKDPQHFEIVVRTLMNLW